MFCDLLVGTATGHYIIIPQNNIMNNSNFQRNVNEPLACDHMIKLCVPVQSWSHELSLITLAKELSAVKLYTVRTGMLITTTINRRNPQ